MGVSVGKKGNIEHHLKTICSEIEKDYPPNSMLNRKGYPQQSYFLMTLDNKAATEASFWVSKVIAQHKKLFEDGELIKAAFLEVADTLFDNFTNKAEVVCY